MGTRIDQMREYLHEEMEARFKGACADIQNEMDLNAAQIREEIRAVFQRIYYETVQMQASGEKGKIKYIIIGYLQHSLNIDRWSFLFQTCDKTFYLDEAETAACYYPDFMWQYYKRDMGYFATCLKRKFVRIKPYELEGIGRDYIYWYNSILLSLMEALVPMILSGEEYEAMKKEEEVQVVFGDYMDQGVFLRKEKKRA